MEFHLSYDNPYELLMTVLKSYTIVELYVGIMRDSTPLFSVRHAGFTKTSKTKTLLRCKIQYNNIFLSQLLFCLRRLKN